MKLDLLKKLQKKLYGYNYGVTLHIDIFEHILDLRLINEKIKEKYPNSTPNHLSFILSNYQELKKEVNDCFDYRGESGSGLKLSAKKEKELKVYILEFWNNLENQIENKTADIYVYPNTTGLAIYPVFWEFAYVIIDHTDHNSYLFYGAASD